MQFIKSKYYNQKFLGKNLYEKIVDENEVLTIQEFFGVNNTQKEYVKKGVNMYDGYYSYKLVIYENYYELDCQGPNTFLFLIFDKPVHIIGEHCEQIIAPEIIIESGKNNFLSCCITNEVKNNNNNSDFYEIFYSKIDTIYFYNEKIFLNESEINNLFLLNQNSFFHDASLFLDYHKTKCFGFCSDLKEKLLNNEKFRKGIIHIE